MPAAKPTPEEIQLEKLRALRVPFAASEIGKLPKPYRRDSQKSFCQICQASHGMPAAHIDYVGHAAITNRLLEVDPTWGWEPFAIDAMGLPAVVNGNLWIRMTVAGVTRIGVGDAEGGNSLKIMIGDAIRNAGMRFGMGLDLWSKEDLHDFASAQGKIEAPQEDVPAAARAAAAPGPVVDTPNPAEMRLRAIEEFNQRIQKLGQQDLATFRQRWVEAKLPKLSEVNEAQFKTGRVLLDKLEKEINDRPLYADTSLEDQALKDEAADYAEPPAEYYNDGVASEQQ